MFVSAQDAGELRKPVRMNMVKRIMGRPRQEECSPQDNALGLMHLRRLFTELCHPPRHMTQKEQEEKLYMMLPVFNRVSQRVCGRLWLYWNQLLLLCFARISGSSRMELAPLLASSMFFHLFLMYCCVSGWTHHWRFSSVRTVSELQAMAGCSFRQLSCTAYCFHRHLYLLETEYPMRCFPRWSCLLLQSLFSSFRGDF